MFLSVCFWNTYFLVFLPSPGLLKAFESLDLVMSCLPRRESCHDFLLFLGICHVYPFLSLKRVLMFIFETCYFLAFLQSAGLLKASGSLDLDVVLAKTRDMSPENLMDLTGFCPVSSIVSLNLPFFLDVSLKCFLMSTFGNCFVRLWLPFMFVFVQSAGLYEAFGSLGLHVLPAITRDMSPEKLTDLVPFS